MKMSPEEIIAYLKLHKIKPSAPELLKIIITEGRAISTGFKKEQELQEARDGFLSVTAKLDTFQEFLNFAEEEGLPGSTRGNLWELYMICIMLKNLKKDLSCEYWGLDKD